MVEQDYTLIDVVAWIVIGLIFVSYFSFKTNNWRNIFTGNTLNEMEFLTQDTSIYFTDYIPNQ